MAIIEHNFEIGFRDTDNTSFLSMKGLLGFLEDIGGIHSDIAGYGFNDIDKNKATWVLLAWKVHIIKNAKYNDTLSIKTWAREASKFQTYRDFEVYNENNELIAIATSKWVFINTETGKIQRLTDDIISCYSPETKTVFDEKDIDKLIEPSSSTNQYIYKVRRCDIDINNHMHNLNYVDLAFETLPEDVYQSNHFTDIEVMYKKATLLGDEVKCLYSFENDNHIVTIKSMDEKSLHAIIYLKGKEGRS